jgi:hypothetical protein
MTIDLVTLSYALSMIPNFYALIDRIDRFVLRFHMEARVDGLIDDHGPVTVFWHPTASLASQIFTFQAAPRLEALARKSVTRGGGAVGFRDSSGFIGE